MSATDILCKRLYYQSWHRGTREADLLLGGFADAYLSTFNEEELREYEALLACSDNDIFDWLQSSSGDAFLPQNSIAERFYRWVYAHGAIPISSREWTK